MALGAISCMSMLVAATGAVGAVGSAAAPGPSGSANRAVPVTGSGKGTQSYNWAGYAQTGPAGSFTSVTGTFQVTTVNTGLSGDQYSSDWVGIDGFSNKMLVQAGVEEDNLNGSALYRAWTEILPAAEVPLSMTVSPGDVVKVTVGEVAKNKWAMTVRDVTRGTSGSRTVSYTTPGQSVEAIHERPTIGGSLATLAQTTDEVFDPVVFTHGSSAPLLTPIAKGKVYDIAMLANNGTTVIARASNADSDHDGFSVADGSAVPPPPAS